MKTNSKMKITITLFACAILSASLVGCNNAQENTPNTIEPPSSLQADTSTADPQQVQIDYYEKLIKDLEAKLLNEKETSYIEISEYKQTIMELEAKIESLTPKNENESSSIESPTRDPELNDQLSTAPPTINRPSDSNNAAVHISIIYKGSVITGYEGNERNVTLPSEVNGTKIKSIGEEAFRGSKIEKIVLSSGIEYIDWFAFADCRSLSEIYIPSSVNSIGYGAFENCSSFLVIKCPEGSYAEAYAKSWGILVITE